jgi:hypothetical protein
MHGDDVLRDEEKLSGNGSRLREFKALGLSEFGLTIIERPKPLGFEFEGACDVQTVESAYPELGTVAAG